MSNHLVKNCRSHDQLEKIRKGQERKFRWRDDWPTMEKALLEAGAEAIAAHEASVAVEGNDNDTQTN
ncbi:hypothetical protein CDA63_11115 [Hymenobacter amundsenii]|uniref:Uncharacterized protein n=1 Tax=Hymenobacter amundsenii TaxID=2006685 RepID=A0A246FKI0_9BACT|nr:hypothetical protein [Hymenobacter amundsenii]OWP63075.1 hypothetical protein CDA63_11115 [Hymenobacter amundsenii]